MSESFASPWTVARQAPLSMEFSRQEYWSALPFPSPGTLPDPEIEPTSILSFALQVDSLPVSYCSSGILAFNFSHAFVWFWYRGNAGLVK